MEQGETLEQSIILNEEEVAAAVKSDDGEVIVGDTVLPSDANEFVLPEKFKGKSAEEIAKAYVELEKLKAEKKEDEVKEPAKQLEMDVTKYYKSYIDNEGLTEADYEELSKQGLSKEQVDEQVEYIKYRTEKAEKEILNGIPVEAFTQAAVKAREAWGEEKAAAFNKTLAESPLHVQQLLVKNMVAEFGQTTSTKEDGPIHTNTPQAQPSKGYATRSDLLRDMSDPRYETDKTFNRMVEAKLAVTDDSQW